MKKKNYKSLAFLLLLLGVGFIIGETIAYYRSSDTFTNAFNTGTYTMEVQELFQSPDDWTPGTTTPKEIVATNRGNIPAAVRIKLTPSWEDEDGNPLDLVDENNVEAAIIDFSNKKLEDWIYNPNDGYYYYNKQLNPNENTSSLIESITFNPNVEITSTKNCSEDEETHSKTCTTETTGYGGGTYK